ncbi:MAG: cobalamin B12-binding domain-containing protein, partial [Actinobacteria bacterium]|nr:cobalamin B12-binding domain-containing protein [Actinomycetota bacterium]
MVDGIINNDFSKYEFLLVEPVAKTPYPPLGLMKISSMLKNKFRNCIIESQVGNLIPKKIIEPKGIYITSLFTWDLKKVVDSIKYYRRLFPNSDIKVGGIAATINPDFIIKNTGIEPHRGIFDMAEYYSP